MHEIDPYELVARSEHPFVRHQVDPADTPLVLALGDALVIDGNRNRTGPSDGSPSLWCLGPTADLARLAGLATDLMEEPGRVSVEAAAYDVLPGAWRLPVSGHWHWMLTHDAPPPHPLEPSVVEVTDAALIDGLLDVANPGSFARPGSRGVECWLGIPGDDGLLAVGALYRDPSGAGHLRSVSTHGSAAGRGLGTAVSAALTRRALAVSGTATLGVYVDNGPALAVYDRLGFRTHVTFRSARR
nr:GNAT family N-acetyltransferase [Nocardioides marinus]